MNVEAGGLEELTAAADLGKHQKPGFTVFNSA